MPLYRIKGLDPDNTYLFDAPPAEDKYELADTPVAPEPTEPVEVDDTEES